MLVLTRRLGESVVIEGGIRVTVVAVRGNKVRVGISAPDAIRVDRQEVHERVADWLDLPAEPASPPRKPVRGPVKRRLAPLPR